MSATEPAAMSPELHPMPWPAFAKTARPLPPFCHGRHAQSDQDDNKAGQNNSGSVQLPITVALADSVVRILVDVIVAGQKLDKATSLEFNNWSAARPRGAEPLPALSDERDADGSDSEHDNAEHSLAIKRSDDRENDRDAAHAPQPAHSATSGANSTSHNNTSNSTPYNFVAEQGMVVMLVGDILRRLNFYCALHDAELCSALMAFYDDVKAQAPAAYVDPAFAQAAQQLDAMVLEKAGTVLRWHGRVLLDSWAQLHDWPRQLLPANAPSSRWPARFVQLQGYPDVIDGCPAWLALRGAAEFGTAEFGTAEFSAAEFDVSALSAARTTVAASKAYEPAVHSTEQRALHWPAERAAMAYAAPRFVRANLLKTTAAQLMQSLADEGIQSQPVPGVDTALWIQSDSALFRSRAFAAGLFEQQDAGSQLVAAALPVKAGLRVIDACAGAGGKSLALAARMQGRGKVLALDIEAWKLDALGQRAKRAAAHCIETRLIVGTKTIKRLVDSADCLLLDVPCSGSGVLRRNPDGKWRDAAQSLAQLLPIQADILQRYSKMLRPNGFMLYATCSIFPSENRQQIDKFLAANRHFNLVHDCTISPAQTGFDGFYYALLQRAAQ